MNPAVADLKALLWPASIEQDFFRYYRPPVLKATGAEHPNFVFIFAESFERTYFDEEIFPGLVTELRELETEGVTFTELHTPDGTGFTMGGIVASLCGIPSADAGAVRIRCRGWTSFSRGRRRGRTG